MFRLGCQTNAWPVDPSRPETLFAALRAIKGLGFTGFETGFRNILPLAAEPALFAKHTLDLTLFGVHIFLPEYDNSTLLAPANLTLEVAKAAAALGAERLILSGAPASAGGELSFDFVQRKASALNSLGRETSRLGLSLAYHNHGPELTGLNPEIDVLLNETDPDLLSLVLDAGHAFRSGIDLPPFLRRHALRVAGIHLRDFHGAEQVPLGSGDFPLAPIAAVLDQQHWSGWLLAEEERSDGSKPAELAATPAYAALVRTFGRSKAPNS